MLRSTRAAWLALLSSVVVVTVAASFAWLGQARVPPPTAQASPAVAPGAPVAAARPAGPVPQAFERLNCSMCHSIGGQGDPASPLDGIGGRMDAALIRAWTVGAPPASEQLSPGVVRRKARVADDPDIDVLVAYLAQLK